MLHLGKCFKGTLNALYFVSDDKCYRVRIKAEDFKNSKSNRMEIDCYNANFSLCNGATFQISLHAKYLRTENTDFTLLVYCDETFGQKIYNLRRSRPSHTTGRRRLEIIAEHSIR